MVHACPLARSRHTNPAVLQIGFLEVPGGPQLSQGRSAGRSAGRRCQRWHFRRHLVFDPFLATRPRTTCVCLSAPAVLKLQACGSVPVWLSHASLSNVSTLTLQVQHSQGEGSAAAGHKAASAVCVHCCGALPPLEQCYMTIGGGNTRIAGYLKGQYRIWQRLS